MTRPVYAFLAGVIWCVIITTSANALAVTLQDLAACYGMRTMAQQVAQGRD